MTGLEWIQELEGLPYKDLKQHLSVLIAHDDGGYELCRTQKLYLSTMPKRLLIRLTKDDLDIIKSNTHKKE